MYRQPHHGSTRGRGDSSLDLVRLRLLHQAQYALQVEAVLTAARNLSFASVAVHRDTEQRLRQTSSENLSILVVVSLLVFFSHDMV